MTGARYYLDADGQVIAAACFDGPLNIIYPIEEAAALLGVDPHKLALSVQDGVVPSFTGPLGILLLRISDVVRAIDCSAQGGWQ